MEYILSYEQILDEDAALVGSKAFRQAELFASGFQVPFGCAVSALNTSAFCLRKLYEELVAYFHDHHNRLTIMRSSASDEDGQHSHAGVYVSVPFSLSDFSAFERATQTLLASYSSTVSRAYQQRIGLMNVPSSFSALVQCVVTASCSGVAYTHHPVTGERSTVLESVWGLNTLLTEGRVSPDYLALNAGGSVIEQRVSTKSFELVVLGNHIVKQPVNDERACSMSISESQIEVLVSTLDRLYEHYWIPLDVEWAFDGDNLYVLQCRSI